jgi:ribonuclease J
MIEYDGDIIVIDLGIQFPEENMPGIDYIVPNMEYLKKRKKDIKAVFITHAHLDHIGAIPHVMEDLGNPVIYTGELTKGMIQRRQEEFPNAPKLKFVTVKKDSKVKAGKFNVEFFHVNHNIVNCFGIFVKTPDGNIVHTGDFKFDDTPLNDEPTDYKRLREMGEQGVDVLLADSTNAAQPGRQISEYTVTTELDKIFDGTQNHGRLIIGTFASNLNRIQQCIELAEKYGRHVILEGRSINNNVEIANELGYLRFNHKNIITAEAYVKNRKNYPDHKVCVIATGAQGERFAFMMRYVNGEHRFLDAERGDTCIFSSSVIPGNERTVSSLKDALARKGCNVFHYQFMDVHAGGHARQEDLIELMGILKPTYYVPIEQSHYVLKVNADLAIDHGHDPDKAFLVDNGQIMAFKKNGKDIIGKLSDLYIPSDYVFVDGLGVGDTTEVVLRDRMILANDGMLVVIVTVDHRTGKLRGNPDLISRGFIYMKDNKNLVEETRTRVKRIANNTDPKTPAFDDHIKNNIREEIAELLFKKTKRRPMILPVVLKV